MNLSNVTEFAGAAVVIPIAIALIKSIWLGMPERAVIACVFALSLGWGVVLWYAGEVPIGGSHLPEWITGVLVTAFAASGLREHVTTLAPALSNLALLQPKPPAPDVEPIPIGDPAPPTA